MTDQKQKPTPLHIALAGERLTNDPKLIEELKTFNSVSLIHSADQLCETPVLPSAHVLILEYSALNAKTDFINGWRKLRNAFPDLTVVLINGGLTQAKIAAAFSEGLQDYFSWPYDVNLLAERIQFLGRLAFEKRITN